MTSQIPKSITLTFRGFDCDPEFVERTIGMKATKTGLRGTPVKLGVETLLKRSYVEFTLEVEKLTSIHEMIPKLVSYLGGVDNIRNVRDQVSPEYFELDFTLPIKFSDEQEGGYLSSDIIEILFNLKCNVSFGFY